MKLIIFFGAFLMVSPLVLGYGNDFKKVKGRHVGEAAAASVRPEPPEETDDTAGAFQSDMLFLPEQMEEVMELIAEEENGLYKRKAVSNLFYRWPQNTVPYELDSSSQSDWAAIQEGINLWTQHTCVQFVPFSTAEASALGHENRVRFYKGSGCSSYVGMVRTGPQQISIGTGCTNPGTIAHEIGHALGWHHEQSRPDRDEAVIINYDNIRSGKELNFAKYSTTQISTHDVPYDVSSIMQYGSGYFSSNGEPTIVARDPVDQFLMGNREGFSFYDIKLANIMFDCAAHCNSNLHCQNEGFVGKDCTCVCKEGYSGNLCETFDPESAGCIRELTDPTGTLTSPGYPDPYGNDQICVWKITGGEGSTISLTFTAFGLEYQSSCSYDKVIIRADNDITSGGQAYCGNSLPPDTESTGNQMLVVFSSDYYGPGSGFEAHYTIHGNTMATVGPTSSHPATTTKVVTTTAGSAESCDSVVGTCGGTFGGSGCIASPNYGHGNYNNNEHCIYNIEVAPGQRVELNLMDLDIEPQSICSWDSLEINLGEGVVGFLKLCGGDRPTGSFVSISNKMQVRLVSDGSINKRGFAAKYQAIVID